MNLKSVEADFVKDMVGQAWVHAFKLYDIAITFPGLVNPLIVGQLVERRLECVAALKALITYIHASNVHF